MLAIREMQLSDIPRIVDYFVKADADFLKGMGVDPDKLPESQTWIDKLVGEYHKPYVDKESYYIIWLLNDEPVGHSNINNIYFGTSATMHLHLWPHEHRQSGLGQQFLRMTIPWYFQHFELKKLICEPYAENIAPNKTLPKLGFQLVRTYDTTPGWINFHQTVNRYELSRIT